MTFTCVQTWDARDAGRGLPNCASKPLFGERASLFVRKSSATLLSVLIHLLLVWLFIDKFAGSPGALAGSGGAEEALTLIDLSGLPAASATAPRRETEAAQTQAAKTSAEATNLDTTWPTDLPTPEWSVTRIVVPAEASQLTPSPASAASLPSGVANGAAGGGSAAPYDPFAGAAPLRREGPSLPVKSGSMFRDDPEGWTSEPGIHLVLDRVRLEAIVRQVTRSVQSARGTAEILVQVAPDGRVLTARPTGGSATDDAKRALRRALIGQVLYQPNRQLTDAQELQLPVIRFG